jgi:hypothetical protein
VRDESDPSVDGGLEHFEPVGLLGCGMWDWPASLAELNNAIVSVWPKLTFRDLGWTLDVEVPRYGTRT